MTATDDVVEDKPDDGPGHVVEGGGGWDETGTAEDDGEVDVLDERVRPLEGDEVASERAESANEEEVNKSAMIRVSANVHRAPGL